MPLPCPSLPPLRFTIPQLYRLKLDNRHLKVILSVGGDTFSKQWYWDFLPNKTERATFVSSAVQMIKDYGFDGIDIDYEYPSNQTEAANFLALITAVRVALDNYSLTYGLNYHFLISTVISADPAIYQFLDLPALAPLVDDW